MTGSAATGYARQHANESLWELRTAALKVADPALSNHEARVAANMADDDERVVVTVEFDVERIPQRFRSISWQWEHELKVEVPEADARTAQIVAVDVAEFVYTTWDVAAVLGVAPDAVYRMQSSGELPHQWSFHTWPRHALEGHPLFTEVSFGPHGLICL